MLLGLVSFVIELVAPSTLLFVLSSIVIQFDNLHSRPYLYTLQPLAALNILHILQSPLIQPTHPCIIGLFRAYFLVFSQTFRGYHALLAGFPNMHCRSGYSEANISRIGSFVSVLVFILHLFINLRGIVFPTNPILHDL